MADFEELFFPTLNSLSMFNKTSVFLIMLAVACTSAFYIVYCLKRLKYIFKNKHNFSFRQDSYILFKIISILFLLYVIYEIIDIISKSSEFM